MKPILLSRTILLGALFALVGCKKKEALDKLGAEKMLPNGVERLADKAAKSDYAAILTLQTRSGRPDFAPLESFLAEIHPETPPDSPALVYLRENLELLFKKGVLDNFLGAWLPMLDAVKNRELIRLIHAVYASERDAHRFWKEGVFLMGLSGDKSLAPGLFEDWKNLPPADLAEVKTGDEFVLSISAPKNVIAGAIFQLDDKATIAEIWRSFPLMGASAQYAMLSTASGSNDFRTAENLRVLISLSDSGKHERVTAMLTQYPSLILLKLLHECPGGDRAGLLRNLADTLAVMERNGLLTSELAEALKDVKR